MRVIQAIFLILACYVTFLVISRHAVNYACILKGTSNGSFDVIWVFEAAAAVLWLTFILVG